MAPVFDHALMFISTGNVTKKNANAALFPTAGLKIRGTPVRGMAVRINIPAVTGGTTVKILPEIHASTNDSTYRIVATYPGGAQSSTTAMELIFGFTVPPSRPYVKLYLKLSGATTRSSLGAVKAGVVSAVGYDWSRTGIVSS